MNNSASLCMPAHNLYLYLLWCMCVMCEQIYQTFVFKYLQAPCMLPIYTRPVSISHAFLATSMVPAGLPTYWQIWAYPSLAPCADIHTNVLIGQSWWECSWAPFSSTARNKDESYWFLLFTTGISLKIKTEKPKGWISLAVSPPCPTSVGIRGWRKFSDWREISEGKKPKKKMAVCVFIMEASICSIILILSLVQLSVQFYSLGLLPRMGEIKL